MLALLSSTATLGLLAAAQTAGVTQHLEAAQTAAGTDMQAPLRLCAVARGNAPAPVSFEDNVKKLSLLPRIGPAKVFDNLYFLGARWSSTWAIDTEEGIILLDALDNKEEAQSYVVEGMRALNLDPARIRFIVISHGHGDHYGGADYLRKISGARLVSSQADWQEMARVVSPHPFFDPPPRRDMQRDIALNDGDTISLGSTVITMHVTPGHTHGTLSPTFDVLDGGRKHRAMLWGGTAFNFGPMPERLQMYANSAKAYKALAARENVEVLLSNHISFDDADKKLAALQKGGPAAKNPFVIGQDAVQRFLTVADECALATKAGIPAKHWTSGH